MEKMCRFSGRSVSIVLWLLLRCSSVALAQGSGTWIEVMVNGPWSYVPDNSVAGHPRIVLIAPASAGHQRPLIFAGPIATTPPANSPQLWPAAYTILIDKVVERTNCGAHPSTDLSLSYPANVSALNIQGALNGTAIDPDTHQPIARYAITLPVPCYATSMYEGRSKMDNVQIDKQPEKTYATWTSLHYFVNSGTLSATLNGVPIPVASDISYPAPSFSILMASDNMSNDNQCDHISLMSVEMSGKLLGINGGLFADFPVMLGSGSATYQTHTYSTDKTCLLPIKPGTLWLTSAGSGDCHMGQININSALR
jgi:hypothetical protein